MPLLGLGVWQIRAGRAAEDAVGWALEAGYRHIDTAAAYGNEESVGRAVRASGLPRSRGFRHHQDALARARPGARPRPEPRAARARPRRPLPHPLAGRRQRAPLAGVRRAAGPGPRPGDRCLQLGRRGPGAAGGERRRASGGEPDRLQPVPLLRRDARGAPPLRRGAGGLQPAGPGPGAPRPGGGRGGAPGGPHARPGLVRWAVQRGLPAIPKSAGASGSPRTARSSTSRCRQRTWRDSTPWGGVSGSGSTPGICRGVAWKR